MIMRNLLRQIRKSETGASAVEFALAAPIALILMVGVIQVGIAMQGYNAIRGMVGDLARHTVVRYSTGVDLADDQIEADAMARATAAPYLLNADNLVIDVQSAESSGIGGVKQIDVTVSYAVRSIIPGLDADQFPMTLEKSIYVVDET
ncbi:TadE/TadG family type IV pilus assembly protein [Sphingorhabdus sp.]|jgi:Flp pilus assembly protein TadG